ncbi:MAG TPA: methyltransferase domain-containing protein, partial [Candidatus Omnitrophota bacterium]|nr:methyltransferase domain-containing protein [Candidatus Omnitrophota bacterium]
MISIREKTYIRLIQSIRHKMNRLFWIKTVAIFTLISFTATNTAWAQNSVPVSDLTASSQEWIPLDQISIPEELGAVQEIYHAGKEAPFIVLIQDAHAVIDAQEHIRLLIEYFQKHYGVGLIALEGGEGPLDATLFRAFPAGEEKRKVFADYVDRGEITGGELAAVFNPGDAVYSGIEDWKLYEENYLAYLRATAGKEAVLKTLRDAAADLDERRKTVYSPALNDFHEHVAAFRRESLSLLDFLKYLKAGFYAGQPASEENYPHLSVLLESVGRDAAGDNAEWDASVRALADRLKERASVRAGRDQIMEFNGRYQDFSTGRADATGFLKYLLNFADSIGETPDLTPLMRERLEFGETLGAIKGTRVFDELESMLKAIEQNLAVTSEAKALAEQYHGVAVLEDMASLEMTRDELREFEANRDNWLSLVSDEGLFRPAEEFYRLAVRRDGALYRNLAGCLKKEGKRSAMVLAGGFHARGFTENLKARGYSYALVTPRIYSLKGGECYGDVMRGKLSYRDYYQTTFYDAFARHATLRLMGSLDEPAFRKTLKAWRDEVIRSLSLENRVGDASRYTRYLDLLFKAYIEKFGAERFSETNKEEILKEIGNELKGIRESALSDIWGRFESQLGRFREALRTLAEGKALTPEAIRAAAGQSGSLPESSLGQSLGPLTPGLRFSGPLDEFFRKGILPKRVLPRPSGVREKGLIVSSLPRYVSALADMAQTRTPSALSPGEKLEAGKLAEEIRAVSEISGPEIPPAPDSAVAESLGARVREINPSQPAEFAKEVLDRLGWESRGEDLWTSVGTSSAQSLGNVQEMPGIKPEDLEVDDEEELRTFLGKLNDGQFKSWEETRQALEEEALDVLGPEVCGEIQFSKMLSVARRFWPEDFVSLGRAAFWVISGTAEKKRRDISERDYAQGLADLLVDAVDERIMRRDEAALSRRQVLDLATFAAREMLSPRDFRIFSRKVIPLADRWAGRNTKRLILKLSDVLAKSLLLDNPGSYLTGVIDVREIREAETLRAVFRDQMLLAVSEVLERENKRMSEETGHRFNVAGMELNGSAAAGNVTPDSDLDVRVLTWDGTSTDAEDFLSELKAEMRKRKILLPVDLSGVSRLDEPHKDWGGHEPYLRIFYGTDGNLRISEGGGSKQKSGASLGGDSAVPAVWTEAVRHFEESGVTPEDNENYWRKFVRIFEKSKLGDPAQLFPAGVITAELPDRNADIFEFGMGMGRLLKELWAQGYHNLTGSDFADEIIEDARQYLGELDPSRLITADVRKYRPAEGERYDGVIASDVMLYLTPEEQLAALRLIGEMIGEEGKAFIRWAPGKNRVEIKKKKLPDGEEVKGWVFTVTPEYFRALIEMSGLKLAREIEDQTVTLPDGREQHYWIAVVESAGQSRGQSLGSAVAVQKRPEPGVGSWASLRGKAIKDEDGHEYELDVHLLGGGRACILVNLTEIEKDRYPSRPVWQYPKVARTLVDPNKTIAYVYFRFEESAVWVLTVETLPAFQGKDIFKNLIGEMTKVIPAGAKTILVDIREPETRKALMRLNEGEDASRAFWASPLGKGFAPGQYEFSRLSKISNRVSVTLERKAVPAVFSRLPQAQAVATPSLRHSAPTPMVGASTVGASMVGSSAETPQFPHSEPTPMVGSSLGEPRKNFEAMMMAGSHEYANAMSGEEDPDFEEALDEVVRQDVLAIVRKHLESVLPVVNPAGKDLTVYVPAAGFNFVKVLSATDATRFVYLDLSRDFMKQGRTDVFKAVIFQIQAMAAALNLDPKIKIDPASLEVIQSGKEGKITVHFELPGADGRVRARTLIYYSGKDAGKFIPGEIKKDGYDVLWLDPEQFFLSWKRTQKELLERIRPGGFVAFHGNGGIYSRRRRAFLPVEKTFGENPQLEFHDWRFPVNDRSVVTLARKAENVSAESLGSKPWDEGFRPIGGGSPGVVIDGIAFPDTRDLLDYLVERPLSDFEERHIRAFNYIIRMKRVTTGFTSSELEAGEYRCDAVTLRDQARDDDEGMWARKIKDFPVPGEDPELLRHVALGDVEGLSEEDISRIVVMKNIERLLAWVKGEFVDEKYGDARTLDPITLAARANYWFNIDVQPFVDGNSKTSTCLSAVLLRKAGLPSLDLLRPENRNLRYTDPISGLWYDREHYFLQRNEEASRGGDTKPFEDFFEGYIRARIFEDIFNRYKRIKTGEDAGPLTLLTPYERIVLENASSSVSFLRPMGKLETVDVNDILSELSPEVREEILSARSVNLSGIDARKKYRAIRDYLKERMSASSLGGPEGEDESFRWVEALYKAWRTGDKGAPDGTRVLMGLAGWLTGFGLSSRASGWFSGELAKRGIEADAYLKEIFDEDGLLREERGDEVEKLLNEIILSYPSESLANSTFATYLNRHFGEYAYFAETVLPLLVGEKLRTGAEKKLRVKVIGTSSGEEMASIYFYLRDAFGKHPEWGAMETWDVEILGVDISGARIREAREKLYAEPRNLGVFMREGFAIRHPGNGMLGEEISGAVAAMSRERREKVFRFEHGNIAHEPFRQAFLRDTDAVFANVVLGYILPPQKGKVVRALLDTPAWILTSESSVYEMSGPRRQAIEIPREKANGDPGGMGYVIPPEGMPLPQPDIPVDFSQPLGEQYLKGIFETVGKWLPTSTYSKSDMGFAYDRARHAEAISGLVGAGELKLAPVTVKGLERIARSRTKFSGEYRSFARQILTARRGISGTLRPGGATASSLGDSSRGGWFGSRRKLIQDLSVAAAGVALFGLSGCSRTEDTRKKTPAGSSAGTVSPGAPLSTDDFIRQSAARKPLKGYGARNQASGTKADAVLKLFQKFESGLADLAPEKAESEFAKFYSELYGLLSPDFREGLDSQFKTEASVNDLYLRVRDYLAFNGAMVFYGGTRTMTITEKGETVRQVRLIHHTLLETVFLIESVGPLGVPVVSPYRGDRDDSRGSVTELGVTVNGVPVIRGARVNEKTKFHLEQAQRLSQSVERCGGRSFWEAYTGFPDPSNPNITVSVPISEISDAVGFAAVRLYGQKRGEGDVRSDLELLTAYHEKQHASDFQNPAVEAALQKEKSEAEREVLNELRARLKSLRYAPWAGIQSMLSVADASGSLEPFMFAEKKILDATLEIISESPADFRNIELRKDSGLPVRLQIIAQLDSFADQKYQTELERLTKALSVRLRVPDLFEGGDEVFAAQSLGGGEETAEKILMGKIAGEGHVVAEDSELGKTVLFRGAVSTLTVEERADLLERLVALESEAFDFDEAQTEQARYFWRMAFDGENESLFLLISPRNELTGVLRLNASDFLESQLALVATTDPGRGRGRFLMDACFDYLRASGTKPVLWFAENDSPGFYIHYLASRGIGFEMTDYVHFKAYLDSLSGEQAKDLARVDQAFSRRRQEIDREMSALEPGFYFYAEQSQYAGWGAKPFAVAPDGNWSFVREDGSLSPSDSGKVKSEIWTGLVYKDAEVFAGSFTNGAVRINERTVRIRPSGLFADG